MGRRIFLALLAVGTVALVGIAILAWLPGPRADLPPGNASASGSTPSRSSAGLPDPSRTPGSVNPNVTAANIGSTICRVGWTATVRPAAAYTNALKLTQLVEYGYFDKNPRDYQEDHLVPLELGGAPRDPKNLWPEPNELTLPDGTMIGSDAKDRLEDYLHRQVCDGAMELTDAQRLIAGDWVRVWQDAGRP